MDGTTGHPAKHAAQVKRGNEGDVCELFDIPSVGGPAASSGSTRRGLLAMAAVDCGGDVALTLGWDLNGT
jgi:hypothetical protein